MASSPTQLKKKDSSIFGLMTRGLWILMDGLLVLSLRADSDLSSNFGAGDGATPR